jgi:hypothetical protein
LAAGFFAVAFLAVFAAAGFAERRAGFFATRREVDAIAALARATFLVAGFLAAVLRAVVLRAVVFFAAGFLAAVFFAAFAAAGFARRAVVVLALPAVFRVVAIRDSIKERASRARIE